MYAILSESKVKDKFSQLELLTLVISCIGHDLDHPGYNNAYQINAGTELAIIYNDTSPLENHHAACLFSVLKIEGCNLVKNLTEAEGKEFRRDCVVCILATDMAKHGEITGKFKGITEGFKIEEDAHRKLLMQMIIKCADISNEVRPQEISEP
jgi:high affinity cGMP-specific 3',5'-cyclic phosphodiesterase 9